MNQVGLLPGACPRFYLLPWGWVGSGGLQNCFQQALSDLIPRPDLPALSKNLPVQAFQPHFLGDLGSFHSGS